MALLDISLVTRALVELLRAHIAQSPAWPYAVWNVPKISPLPPDQLEAGSLGVYLYHLTENAYFKNVATGSGPTPVRLAPMSLSLHYQVSARGMSEAEQGTFQEQTLVGCAVKALHDFPTIDDSTRVPRRAPQPPLDLFQTVGLDGEGNRITIVMQPVAYHEAASFWSAGSLVPRLAVYYEVSVVLLKPESPQSISGRVERIGIQSFTNGAPRLDSSESIVVSAPPGLPPQDLVARPAQVPFDGVFALTGSDLAGDSSTLLLTRAGWPGPLEVDGAWATSATADRVQATARQSIGARSLTPGIYAARVRVSRRRTLPDGTVRTFATLSNATPVTLTARIDAVVLAAGIGTITGWAFASPDASVPAFPTDAVQLTVGGAMLSEVPTAAPAPAVGEFMVDSATTIRFGLPASAAPGIPVAVRVFVDGAESPAEWITP